MQIAGIGKNTHEKMVVSVEEYKGHSLCDCRVYFEGQDGQWQPLRRGIALTLENISFVIEALRTAREKLRAGKDHQG